MKNTFEGILKLNLPSSYSNILKEDPALESMVYHTLNAYSDWLYPRKAIPLFPDYTNHGIEHLQRILDLSEIVIANGKDSRPNSFELLSPVDISILVFSILLHDIGMHLDEKAFIRLVRSDNTRIIVSDLDKKRWPSLWEEYLGEARRWDSKYQNNIFGNLLSSNSTNRPVFRRPSDDVEEWDQIDRLLAGEFLRRHHPRLAHEIAIEGWTTEKQEDNSHPLLQIGKTEEHPLLATMAGIVARSHGQSLRSCFPFLKRHFGNLRETNGAHIIYLMTILRISDYLHLHAERAKGGEKRIQKISSPISKREFAAHQAILDVRLESESDPEAIGIDVNYQKLESAKTYFRIKEWLIGLQKEIDDCWAVLGEIYGRYQLRDLWLSLRRINSNIFEDDFINQLTFLPQKATFETSHGDFLKLLVIPLYGNRPEVGIRELLQNSIDAVRERREYENLNKRLQSEWQPIHPDFDDSDIIISVCNRSELQEYDSTEIPDHWESWIEICDRGIGMTATILRDYYLKAGATFRKSEDWAKIFLDKNNHSNILRSGRFGVGALATFLLGDEIQLRTQHIEAEESIEFLSKLNSDLIEFKRGEKRDPGTTIRVHLNKETYDRLSDRYGSNWNWYFLSFPKVTRKVNHRNIDWDEEEELFLRENHFPDSDESLPLEWHRVSHPEFKDIMWTYDLNFIPKLLCNGIKIELSNDSITWKNNEVKLNNQSHQNIYYPQKNIKIPSLSVFDRDGNLPLNLSRDRLTSNYYPFNDELLTSIIRDAIAHSLVIGPNHQVRGKKTTQIQNQTYPGFQDHSKLFSPWIWLKNGFTFADPELLLQADVKVIILFIGRSKAFWFPSFQIEDDQALFSCKNYHKADNKKNDWVWPLLNYHELAKVTNDKKNPFKNLNFNGSRILLPKPYLELLEDYYKHFSVENDPQFETQLHSKNFLIAKFGRKLPNLKDTLFQFLSSNLALKKNCHQAGLICEWYLSEDQNTISNSPIAKIWNEIIRQPLIPYSTDARKKQLSHAYKELDDEIYRWETKLKIKYEEKTKLLKDSNGAPLGFFRATQIKKYLKEQGITRKVRCFKLPEHHTDNNLPSFHVFLVCKDEEFGPSESLKSRIFNPFESTVTKARYDMAKIPDFKLIFDALKHECKSCLVTLGR